MPITARVFKFWEYPDLRWQTPGRSGRWRGVQFHFDESGPCDYTIIHGSAGTMHWTLCPASNVWLLVGEPPNETLQHVQQPTPLIRRVYTTDATKKPGRFVLSQPCLPWHVQRDFDELDALGPMPKTRDLSWITSDRTDTEGHRLRMAFLQRLKNGLEFDLFGRGFDPIADKWDGLAPYRYSVAFENFANSHYWSEKIMDCFLAWTMPIYYGCTEIEKFFPAESFVRIDPTAPDAIEQVRRIVGSDLRERNLAAIGEARRRVLHDHNVFELMTREIERAEASRPAASLFHAPLLIRNHTLTFSRCFRLEIRERVARVVRRFRPEPVPAA